MLLNVGKHSRITKDTHNTSVFMTNILIQIFAIIDKYTKLVVEALENILLFHYSQYEKQAL